MSEMSVWDGCLIETFVSSRCNLSGALEHIFALVILSCRGNVVEYLAYGVVGVKLHHLINILTVLVKTTENSRLVVSHHMSFRPFCF